jgi:signal transduction histidine kinase
VRPARAEQFAEITVEDERGAPLPDGLGRSRGWPRAGNGDRTAAGLGLTVARTVAASHGGSVDVRSPAEGGVALVLRLPVAGTAIALEA